MSVRSKRRTGSSTRKRADARRPLGRPGTIRPPAPGGWRRRHRVELHHALWVTIAFAFAVEARVIATRFEDDYLALVVFGSTAVVWAVLGCLIGLLTAPPSSRSERRARARRVALGGRGRPTPPPGPVPWRLPWLLAYALGMPALVLAASALAPVDGDATVSLVIIWAFCSLAGALTGFGVYLLGSVLVLVVLGVIGFGLPALTGRVDGEPVPRAPYVGPFVALLGLLPLPAVLAGAASYDSPRRRDLLPLVGAVRDDVEVTHPALLLVSQVATWWLLGGLAVGAAMSWWAASRARGAAQQQPDV